MRAGAALPLLAASLAVILVAASGLSQRSLAGTVLEDRLYGFFADRYPLFVFAIVYGAARLCVLAAEPRPRRWLGLALAPLAITILLALCLHPTFGGLALRAGFIVGGMSFLQGVPLPAAYALGAAVSAAMFGTALALGTALVRRRIRFSRRGGLFALLAFAALWLGALVLAAPWALGFAGAWPKLPMSAAEALRTLALVLAALAPHAIVAAARDRGVESP